MQIALFFTRTCARVLRPGLAQIVPEEWADRSHLRRSFDHLIRAIDQFVAEAKLAA
jgi:hypothetical protein